MRSDGFRYFRRRLDEPVGGPVDGWGGSTWYFESHADGVVTRQVEEYDAGPTLRYGEYHLTDDYGGLTDQPLDLDEFAAFEVTAEEFERVWAVDRGSESRRRNDGGP